MSDTVILERNANAASPQRAPARGKDDRSEEHTSELQSLTNVVCRLLLEKKMSAALDGLCSRSLDLICFDRSGSLAPTSSAHYPHRPTSMPLTNSVVHYGWTPPRLRPVID